MIAHLQDPGNPDTLDHRIGTLSEGIQEFQAARDEVRDKIRDEENALARMQGSADAAETAARAQNVVAEISGHAEQHTRTTALDAGVARFLLKPIGPNELCDTLRRILETN